MKLIFSTISNYQMETQLILHFDINGTITNYDSTEKADHNQMANMILSRYTFGQIINNVWQIKESPFIETPHSVTYYDYLKKYDPIHYKEKSFCFTHPNQPGSCLKEDCQTI